MSNYFAGQTVPAHKDTLMVHCLDTPPKWSDGKGVDEIMREVTRWHVSERGWRGVAYAAVFDYDGGVALGRDLDGDGNVLEETGAGARGHNRRVIHLALVGGKGSTANDLFSDHYTAAQDKALRDAIDEIQRIAGRKMKVKGHNDVAAKACPGFKVGPWLAKKPQRDKLTQSTTVQASGVQIVTAGGGAVSAIAALDGAAQIVAVVICGVVVFAALWIMKERLRSWAAGWRS